MKYTLRKAHKIEAAIAKAILPRSQDLSIVVDPYETTLQKEITRRVALKQQANAERVEELSALIDIRYTIRRKIQQQNDAVGISDLMNRRKAHQATNTLLSEVVSDATYPDFTPLDTIAKRIETAINSGNVLPTIHVPAISDQVLQSIRDNIRQTEIAIEDINDSLDELNHKTTIDMDWMSPEDVDLLVKYGIIVQP